jgi:hypothetical protein
MNLYDYQSIIGGYSRESEVCLYSKIAFNFNSKQSKDTLDTNTHSKIIKRPGSN